MIAELHDNPAGRRILLVEDSVTQGMQLQYFLERSGHRTVLAKNGRLALEKLRDFVPEIIISDIKMPQMDGYELCRQVKNNPEWANIPFVLLTSFTAPEDVLNSLASGADGFIYKSLSKDDLLAAINHWMERGASLSHTNGVENVRFDYGGYGYDIPSDHGHILRFLVDVYRMIIRHNEELNKARNELDQANNHLQQARQAADDANRAKSDFLANMSHEIRTPMNAIMGMTHLVRKTNLSARQEDYLSKIDRASQNLLTIINDILDFSKIEAGKLDMENTPFVLEEVLLNLADMVSDRGAEKDIELLFRVDPDVPQCIEGDPLRLGQVLLNLVGNAVKFTEKGHIAVIVKLRGGDEETVDLSFSVKDTGIGMTEEQTAMLFQPFTQVDASTTRKYGGTGLGLTISKRLVDMMDGEIEVSSQKGIGSNFQFTARFGVTEQPQDSAKNLPHEMHGMRALIVDDNEISRDILVSHLSAWGFEIGVATCGADGLKELADAVDRGEPYDFALLDYRMPGMNGVEVGRQIRGASALSRLPLIMVTAYGREEVRAKAANSGIDFFLIKPVTRSVLFNTIMEALGRYESGASCPCLEGRDANDGTQDLAGMRVLLVEDNEINQEVASEILEDWGAVVTVAENGRKALDLVSTEFDAVLMDIQMPEMDGIEAAQKIRERDELSKLSIIAMTAHAMRRDKERHLQVGMNDHISKPINPEELLQVLKGIIGEEVNEEESVEEDCLTDSKVLDTEAGVNRLRGKHDKYSLLLEKFLEGHSDDPDAIASALAEGRRDEARDTAHAVKGVAGSLGAVRLYDAATSLEAALCEGCDSGEVRSRSARFGQEMDRLIPVISRELDDARNQADAKSQQEARPENSHSVWERLRELTALLKASDAEAVHYLSDIDEKEFADVGLGELKAQLSRFVARYDFDSALALLEEVVRDTNTQRD